MMVLLLLIVVLLVKGWRETAADAGALRRRMPLPTHSLFLGMNLSTSLSALVVSPPRRLLNSTAFVVAFSSRKLVASTRHAAFEYSLLSIFFIFL